MWLATLINPSATLFHRSKCCKASRVSTRAPLYTVYSISRHNSNVYSSSLPLPLPLPVTWQATACWLLKSRRDRHISSWYFTNWVMSLVRDHSPSRIPSLEGDAGAENQAAICRLWVFRFQSPYTTSSAHELNRSSDTTTGAPPCLQHPGLHASLARGALSSWLATPRGKSSNSPPPETLLLYIYVRVGPLRWGHKDVFPSACQARVFWLVHTPPLSAELLGEELIILSSKLK